MSQSPSRTVYVGQLPFAEKERFLEFLVANKIEFVAEDNKYVATIQVVPPESQTFRLGGRVQKPAAAPAPGAGRSRSAEPKALSARTPEKSGIPPQGDSLQDPAATRRAAQTCLRKRYNRFCNLLPPLNQRLKKLQDPAVMRFAEDLYEARFSEECDYWKKKAALGQASPTCAPRDADSNQEPGMEIESLPRFPDFFFEFARKRFGLKTMVCTNCWAMVGSMELLRGGNTHIEIFGRFVEESFDAEDLTFFLYVRAEIEEVISKLPRKGQLEEPATNDVNYAKKAEAAAKKSQSTNRKKIVFQGLTLTHCQCADVLKAALRKVAPKKMGLMNPMLARIQSAINERSRKLEFSQYGQGQPAGLDPTRILLLATEEYRNSRDIEEPERDQDDFFTFLQSCNDPKEYTPNIPANLKELDSAVRKEVKQTVKSLIEGMVAAGKSEINQSQLLDWALNVVMRRHDRGEYSDKNPEEVEYSLDLDEMIEATDELHLDPNAPQFGTGHYEVILEMEADEFELHFEENIRQLLLYALEQNVGTIIDEISGAFYDARSRSQVRTKIAISLAPMADSLMEAVISKDYKKWLRSLAAARSANAEKKSMSNSARQRQIFQKLHEEFQLVVSQTPVTPYNIHRMCKSIVGVEEINQRIRNLAAQLSRDPAAELADHVVDQDDDEKGSEDGSPSH